MALQASGQISLSDIAAEFGGTAPHSMSEYYGGGDNVPAGANPGIATSGAINMNSFYGGVAATVLNITSSVNNYDIGAQAISAGGDKSTPVILTINSGVTVGSTSSSTAAMYTGTGWSSGTTINITNNGSIVGSAGVDATGAFDGATGGNGGNGNPGTGFSNGLPGGAGTAGGGGSATSVQDGGDAFYHSQTADNNLSVIFDTVGTRTAGAAGVLSVPGGGGGGGSGGDHFIPWTGTHGGGGGGGAASGLGGNQGGVAATTTVGGAGGSSGAGNGGAGGNGGLAGNAGANSTYTGGSGGAAGASGSASGSAGSALAGNTGQIS